MAALGSNMKGRKKSGDLPAEPNKTQQKKAVKETKPKAKSSQTKVSAKKQVEPQTVQNAIKENKKEETKTILIELKNAELILEPSKRRKIRKIRVYLEGELVINNIQGFIQRIHPVFKDYDYIDFSLRKVTSLDLCFIQMLYHMKKSYGKKKKEVTIDSELSSDLKKIIVHAGFEELMFIPKLV